MHSKGLVTGRICILEIQEQSYCLLFRVMSCTLPSIFKCLLQLYLYFYLPRYTRFSSGSSNLHIIISSIYTMELIEHEVLTPSVSFSLYERRRQFRESLSLDRYMTLTEYIVRTDPLSSTTLIHWPHHPVESPCPELATEITRFNPEIRSTLRSHGIPDIVEKTTHLITQTVDPCYPNQVEVTPQKLLRIHLDDHHYLPPQLDAARDALNNMLQRLGLQDVHVDLIYGSNLANFRITDEETIDIIKVQLAIELAAIDIFGFLQVFIPDTRVALYPYMTRQYGLAVPTVVVAIDAFSQTNWLRLRRLILQELRKYTKMALEVEFHPVYEADEVEVEFELEV